MNIWLVSIFEQTPIDQVFSTRFISIADEAVKRGHQVTFFASTFKHNTKNQRFNKTTTVQQAENYQLVFVESDAYQNNVSLRRMWAHRRYADRIVKELDQYDKPDVILMAFPPISLSDTVTQWAKKKEVPVVVDIIDPWPDIFQRALSNFKNRLAYPVFWWMKRRVGQSFGRLTHITGISEEYVQWGQQLATSEKPGTVFYPATDLDLVQSKIQQAKAAVETDADDKFYIIYAGSLAGSYDIECILGAAAILEEKYSNKIHFLIAGAGPQENIINDYMEEHQNLSFLGRLPKDDLMKFYAKAHLGTTQHVKGATQTVTYKLFDLLSAGLPILNSLESEMKGIIEENRVGLFNEPGNADQLAKNIEKFYHDPKLLEEYRANGFELTRKKGDTKTLYSRFVNLLEETARDK